MGFTSQDDLLNQITTNAKTDSIYYQKTTDSATNIAGTWRMMDMFGGTTPAKTYAGTSLTYYPTDDTWSEGALGHGGNVSTATKHFLSAGATIGPAAAGAPWFIMVMDQLGYVPITGTDVTGTSSRTITMTALDSGARYPNGAGLRCFFSTETAPATGAPNISAFTYTNQAGTTGRTMPTVAASVVSSMHATPIAGAVPHSGAVANRIAPFLPLAATDTGIRDLEAFTFSGGTAYTGSGALVLHLVKPLFVIPVPASGLYSILDFVNTLPSLPQIKDGACLTTMFFQSGATTASVPIMMDFKYAYGG